MYFFTLVCITLALLWVFQIVFLDGFYKTIKSTKVEQAAHQISLSIKNGDNAVDVINNVSRKNNLSVSIYDTSTSIFYKLYSKKIIGYAFGQRMTNDLVVKALKNAYYSQSPDKNKQLIFHSDLGS